MKRATSKPWWRERSPDVSRRQFFSLCLAAALLGLVTAVGVWLFGQAISSIHAVSSNLQQAGGVWMGPMILALGGIVVALFMQRFGRPARLAAMPHIIDAVTGERVQLDKRNGFVFVIASALSVGLGAPVGADTPAAMIGGHLAFWLGERYRQHVLFIRVLVVAGAAAGISATFFAQIAAVFFAFEIVLGGLGGAVYVVPVLIAVAVSSTVTFTISGAPPQYAVGLWLNPWNVSLLVVLLGATLLATLASIAFVNLLPWFRSFWTRVKLPFWVKTGLAGAVVGLVAIWLPGISGSGLTQMKQVFSGALPSVGTLLALAAFRLILTPWSLGSGFAGGVIGPSLAIGAALGAAYGELINMAFPNLGVAPEIWAAVAVAAMLSATFHAPLFGAMMVYEMVADYRILAPLFLAAAIAFGLARHFQPGSAFSLWLSPATTADQPQAKLFAEE